MNSKMYTETDQRPETEGGRGPGEPSQEQGAHPQDQERRDREQEGGDQPGFHFGSEQCSRAIQLNFRRMNAGSGPG